MKNKVSVSVGIPAYNEAGNIATLLRSILSQKQENYRLEHIFVVCDGCTDNTAQIVSKLARHQSIISLIERKQRKGKAHALNHIYKINNSDFLLTVDADLAFKTNLDLDYLVCALSQDSQISVVGPKHIPVPQKTFWGKLAYVSYLSFEDAFLNWREGNNYYGLMSSTLIRKELTKSFVYPIGTVSDQCYLFVKATRNNPNGFKLIKKSSIFFSPVSTFQDWRLLGVRSVAGDKADLVKHFGPEILLEIALPKHLLIISLIKWLLKSPFYTTGSILMNIYIRKFPYQKMSLKKGIWETTMSAKKAIRI